MDLNRRQGGSDDGRPETRKVVRDEVEESHCGWFSFLEGRDLEVSRGE